MNYTGKIKKVHVSDPILLNDIKDNLGIERTYLDEDILLTRIMEDAISATENRTDRIISLKGCTITLATWKSSTIRIPLADLSSITSIKEGTTNVTYTLHEEDSHFVLEFEKSDFKNLVIKFQSGYTTADLPREMRSPCLIKASDMYDMERQSYVIGTIAAKLETWDNLCKLISIVRL